MGGSLPPSFPPTRNDPRPDCLQDSTAPIIEAREVDSDIEIHFDITGQSSTEGRISDMQSCFKSRLVQIRRMMISHGVLQEGRLATLKMEESPEANK